MAENSHPSRPSVVVWTVVALVGAVAAALLGLLTFGVQASAEPRDVPLAIAAPAPAIAQITSQGGDAVSWHVVSSREEAVRLLEDGEVYGALLLAPEPAGVRATMLLSGGINPTGTQVAQQVLGQVGGAALGATHSTQPVVTETIHPTSPAGRVLPLAASALLWIGTLVCAVLSLLLVPRLTGRPLGLRGRLATAAASTVLVTGVVLGFAALWDSGLTISWSMIGFLVLVAGSFALLQGAVLRLLGRAGIPLLALLYLMAPAVAGQVGELLNPAYRVLLWSWTPFRFSTEATRNLLVGTDAPIVGTAVLVFAVIAVISLLVLAVPARRVRVAPAEPDAATSSVDIGWGAEERLVGRA